MQALTQLGLTTNLQFCLDAGDAASYTSGTSWLDRSGNGFDFFLGADGTVSSTDPTFTGPAGNRISYWAFDGTQYFTYDTTNEASFQTLHKDNAVLSIVAFVYSVGGATDAVCGDTGSAGGQPGIEFRLTGTTLNFIVTRLAGNALSVTGDSAMAANAWHMVAVSLTEATGAGGGFLYMDGAYNQVSASDTFTSTYSSPSASSAAQTLQIAALGAGGAVIDSGARLSAIALSTSAWTKANMDSIWAAMRGRFGI